MRLRHAFGFSAFCLLAGSRWLIEGVWSPALPSLLRLCLAYAVVGLPVLLLLIWRGDAGGFKPQLWQLGLAGLLFLGVPSLVGTFTASIDAETRVALYAMAPLCVVVMAMTRDEASRASMLPALIGLSGVLLLLPWRLPSTGAAMVAFSMVAGGVLLTAAGGVSLHVLLREKPLMPSLGAIALSNALLLGFAASIHHDRFVAFNRGDCAALCIDVSELFLLVWLAGGVAPERVAVRFLLVPLITILEGVAMLRPPVDARMVAGMLLTAVGVGALLLGKRESVLSLNLR